LLSIGNVSGLLSLGRLLVIPFITVGILNQFGFEFYPDILKGEIWSPILMIVLTTVVAFLVSEVAFQVIIISEYILAKGLGFIGYKVGTFMVLMSVSFTSIGLLGFYKPVELAHIEQPFLFAFGAYGLYLFDVHFKTKKSIR